MVNQVDINIRKTPTTAPVLLNQPKIKAVKQNFNYWKIATIGFFIILIAGALGFFYYNKSDVNTASRLVSKPTSTPVSHPKIPVSLNYIDLKAQSINDLITELFFSENNSVYSSKQNGPVNKLGTFEGNITNILLLPNKKDLLVVTQKPETQKEIYDQATNKMIPVVDPHTTYWILKEDTKQIEKFPYTLSEAHPLRDFEEMTTFEQIFTKASPSGGADILLDKLDGSTPTKIGFLNEEPLERKICEIGDNCKEKYYPDFFIPSFDESYLLSRSPRGGGLGEPAIVISRDGSKIYRIDFYWYVSAAAWIDNNKLLAQDRKGAKLFTFNNDGTFETTNIKSAIGDQFSQHTLSPSKKYIGVITYKPNYEIILFDVVTFEKKVIERIQPGTVDSNNIHIIGWNRSGNILLYVIGDKAKIYDSKTGKSNLVASLKNGVPNWVKMNRASFAQNIFEIR